ncbi:nucleotidyltransferase family protein [Bizionia arctica]|uniref:Nucleotidyltransferase family protein n=1 Tax=Bizionia arctica TaxID=1495645 RepID=A0A917GXB7_9FLAO|nr:nucleotidyltransferase family protein [Bizionia arctica]GGG60053.1 hypothetical protein GCM10010976_33500 [Bizionia arctica]
MVSYYHTLKVIASILSYKNDPIQLKKLLSNPLFDWETLVKYASRHLVLPTIYTRLDQKSLLHVLPLDLKEYLNEITSINRNRNTSILNDVNNISNLFQTHHINHVFLKGTALLAGAYYSDLGERMIGDIDILVDSKDMHTAYQLLLNANFEAAQESPLHQYTDHKHLPRLIPKSGLAAVEIHRRLFNSKNTSLLMPNSILESKQLINKVFIPSNIHLLQHSVLNWQINDKGYYFSKIGFRSAFDSLTILNRHPEICVLDEINNKYSKNYFQLLSLFFDEIEPQIFKKNSLKLYYLKYKFEHTKLSHLIDYVLNKLSFLKVLFQRIYMFIINKEYRKAVLADYNRIFKLLKISKF